MSGYLNAPPDSPIKKRTINFACVVFDGPMFACKTTNVKLDKIEYQKYKHVFGISPNITDKKILDFAKYIFNTLGYRYIIEFIHLDNFSNYIDELNASLNKLDEANQSSFLKEWV